MRTSVTSNTKITIGAIKSPKEMSTMSQEIAMNIKRVDSSLSCREFADDHIERESNERYVEDL